MKPCRRCGGDKAPGSHSRYCPPCAEVARAEYNERQRERQREWNRARARRSRTEPLRVAFSQADMTKSDVARALGWMWGDKPDTRRVARALSQPTVNSQTAMRLAPVLGLDPVDIGQ